MRQDQTNQRSNQLLTSLLSNGNTVRLPESNLLPCSDSGRTRNIPFWIFRFKNLESAKQSGLRYILSLTRLRQYPRLFAMKQHIGSPEVIWLSVKLQVSLTYHGNLDAISKWLNSIHY